MQEKLAITVLVMMLALIALTVILYTMVQNKNEDYTQVVLSHQDYDSRTIPYRRGDIVDRNGSYLGHQREGVHSDSRSEADVRG